MLSSRVVERIRDIYTMPNSEDESYNSGILK